MLLSFIHVGGGGVPEVDNISAVKPYLTTSEEGACIVHVQWDRVPVYMNKGAMYQLISTCRIRQGTSLHVCQPMCTLQGNRMIIYLYNVTGYQCICTYAMNQIIYTVRYSANVHTK